ACFAFPPPQRSIPQPRHGRAVVPAIQEHRLWRRAGRRDHVLVLLVPDKPLQSVLLREPIDPGLTVLPGALLECIARNHDSNGVHGWPGQRPGHDEPIIGRVGHERANGAFPRTAVLRTGEKDSVNDWIYLKLREMFVVRAKR